jgi:transcriptional regulator with XRE-family HTH domain
MIPVQAFWKAFKQLRSEKGLSQKTIASRSGLSNYLIKRIEQEEANLPLDKIFNAARGLGVKANELTVLAEKILLKNGGH